MLEAIPGLDRYMDPPEDALLAPHCGCPPCPTCKGKPEEPSDVLLVTEDHEDRFTCYHGEDDHVCQCVECFKCGRNVLPDFIRRTHGEQTEPHCPQCFMLALNLKRRLYSRI